MVIEGIRRAKQPVTKVRFEMTFYPKCVYPNQHVWGIIRNQEIYGKL
jgi:hypothetical protein